MAYTKFHMGYTKFHMATQIDNFTWANFSKSFFFFNSLFKMHYYKYQFVLI